MKRIGMIFLLVAFAIGTGISVSSCDDNEDCCPPLVINNIVTPESTDRDGDGYDDIEDYWPEHHDDDPIAHVQELSGYVFMNLDEQLGPQSAVFGGEIKGAGYYHIVYQQEGHSNNHNEALLTIDLALLQGIDWGMILEGGLSVFVSNYEDFFKSNPSHPCGETYLVAKIYKKDLFGYSSWETCDCTSQSCEPEDCQLPKIDPVDCKCIFSYDEWAHICTPENCLPPGYLPEEEDKAFLFEKSSSPGWYTITSPAFISILETLSQERRYVTLRIHSGATKKDGCLSDDFSITSSEIWFDFYREGLFYRDVDMDGFGSDTDTVLGDRLPEGYAKRGGDCNDMDGEINPGMEEIPNNAVDENCNGRNGSLFSVFSSREYSGYQLVFYNYDCSFGYRGLICSFNNKSLYSIYLNTELRGDIISSNPYSVSRHESFATFDVSGIEWDFVTSMEFKMYAEQITPNHVRFIQYNEINDNEYATWENCEYTFSYLGWQPPGCQRPAALGAYVESDPQTEDSGYFRLNNFGDGWFSIEGASFTNFITSVSPGKNFLTLYLHGGDEIEAWSPELVIEID